MKRLGVFWRVEWPTKRLSQNWREMRFTGITVGWIAIGVVTLPPVARPEGHEDCASCAL